MIKFSGLTQDGKGRLIGIALSRRNCERLLEGDPIAFDLSELGMRVIEWPRGTRSDPPANDPAGAMIGQVLIIAGETEKSIMAELGHHARAAGVEIRKVD